MNEVTPEQILSINPELPAQLKPVTSLGLIIFWLVGFTPVGCFFVWTRSGWPAWVKLLVIIISMGLFLGLLLESELISNQLLGGLGAV